MSLKEQVTNLVVKGAGKAGKSAKIGVINPVTSVFGVKGGNIWQGEGSWRGSAGSPLMVTVGGGSLAMVGRINRERGVLVGNPSNCCEVVVWLVCLKYFIILFRVNQVFTFYHLIKFVYLMI